ncbi:rCG58347, isoform CRA_a [Rattus norvegicus]|uniref:RCG58347, isoform CRA_a n=1 Tax=Rattus norvegicus TaxID=10116 RepID=A6J4F0_RAT|nr:rCG58347, isoform CRA_a [Rattus norvegicus]EDL95475.1 rCG58347, isoform CRA_a [Rattus norvegicus]
MIFDFVWTFCCLFGYFLVGFFFFCLFVCLFVFLFFFFLRNRISCSPDWPGTGCIAEDGLDIIIYPHLLLLVLALQMWPLC